MEKSMPIVPALIGTVMGVVVLIGVVSYLGGRNVPFARDDRSAIIALAVAGLVMCAFGIQTTGGSTGWLSPGMFAGAIFGVVLLTVFVAALANRPVPVIGAYRTALVAMASIMGVKWVISTASLVTGFAR